MMSTSTFGYIVIISLIILWAVGEIIAAFFKHSDYSPKMFICCIMAVIIAFSLVIGSGYAEEPIDTDGVICEEFIHLVGEHYAIPAKVGEDVFWFYSNQPFWSGHAHLLLIGDKVIDAFSIDVLEAPFR